MHLCSQEQAPDVSFTRVCCVYRISRSLEDDAEQAFVL